MTAPIISLPGLRIGTAERERVAVELRGHHVAGHITGDELHERLQHASHAATESDLTRVLVDLPDPVLEIVRHPPTQAARPRQQQAIVVAADAMIMFVSVSAFICLSLLTILSTSERDTFPLVLLAAFGGAVASGGFVHLWHRLHDSRGGNR